MLDHADNFLFYAIKKPITMASPYFNCNIKVILMYLKRDLTFHHSTETDKSLEVLHVSESLTDGLSRCEGWVGDSDDTEVEIQTDVGKMSTGCPKAWAEHLRQIGLDWFG